MGDDDTLPQTVVDNITALDSESVKVGRWTTKITYITAHGFHQHPLLRPCISDGTDDKLHFLQHTHTLARLFTFYLDPE